MSTKRSNLRRLLSCAKLAVPWFSALSGCGDATVDATSNLDVGAEASTGGNGGSSGAALTDAGTACTNPVFSTSDPVGLWSDGGYWLMNNMWNAANYQVTQTLYACSYHSFYVVANMNNDTGDGAVKTYPNSHKDYNDVPISSFSSITSSFAAMSPHVGIYNVAYDIWTNGVATLTSNEIMIWTENYNQVPTGSRTAMATLGGRTYEVWTANNNHYIALVANTPFTSGTLDLLEIFQWATTQGLLPSGSTLGAIDFGVEIVDTGGTDATFEFTDFSITTG